MTARHVAEFIAWLCDEEKQGRRLSDKTIRNIVGPLRACLATARCKGLIRHNPCDGAQLPHRPEVEEDDEHKDVRAFGRDQLAAFLAIVHPRHRLLFRLLAATALRISEAIALQRENGEHNREFNFGELGEPGERFSEDSFLSTRLSFASSEVDDIRALGGAADAAASLTLNATHIEGVVPESGAPPVGAAAHGGGGGFGGAGGFEFDNVSVSGVDVRKPGLAMVTPDQVTQGRYFSGAPKQARRGFLGAAIGIAGAAIIDAVGPTLEASVEARSTGGFGPFGQESVTAGSADVVLGAPVDVDLLVLAVGLAIVGGLVAGAAGGLRAARLRPAEALRSAE